LPSAIEVEQKPAAKPAQFAAESEHSSNLRRKEDATQRSADAKQAAPSPTVLAKQDREPAGNAILDPGAANFCNRVARDFRFCRN